jgi:16S rRNA (guanine966-N2)-methyltransferase
MRVIAGSARGTRLARVPAGTRPLSDRAREGLFSSLGASVSGAEVLDLYAGTGALGIEALSRGAEAATLVDRSHEAIRTIHDNLARTGLAPRSRVILADVQAYLGRRPRPYGLCLADPPYGAPIGQLERALALLDRGWLATGFTVALTRRRKAYTLGISVHWQVTKRLEYGDTVIVLYREAS